MGLATNWETPESRYALHFAHYNFSRHSSIRCLENNTLIPTTKKSSFLGKSTGVLYKNPKHRKRRRMNRFLMILMVSFIAAVLLPKTAASQTSRVVTATETNGTYRDSGKEFRVLALGHHKLKVQFNGTYQTITKSVNYGSARGQARIEGNVATFSPEDKQNCKITMTFLTNKLVVKQDGEDFACGFGHNVNATGTYRKVRGGKPRFVSSAIEKPASLSN